MVIPSALQTELTAVTDRLIQQLQSFSPDVFTKKPHSESWSAAEVAEHILIVNKNLGYVLQAEGSIPDRAPDKKLAGIREVLLDRRIKLVVPENVKPTGTMQNQQEVIAGLQKQLQVLRQVVEEKDLNELCEVYAHPRVGRLTRLEWIYFIIYHTERHCQQLQEIYSQVMATV